MYTILNSILYTSLRIGGIKDFCHYVYLCPIEFICVREKLAGITSDHMIFSPRAYQNQTKISTSMLQCE